MNKREVGIEIQTQIIRHGELEQFGIGHQQKNFAQNNTGKQRFCDGTTF